MERTSEVSQESKEPGGGCVDPVPGFNRITNIDQGISNVEGRNTIDFYRFRGVGGAILSLEILRFVILRFCGSLFKPGPAIEAADLTDMETSTC